MASAPLTVLRVGLVFEADVNAAKAGVASFRDQLVAIAAACTVGSGGLGTLDAAAAGAGVQLATAAAGAGSLAAATVPLAAASAAAAVAIEAEGQAAVQAAVALTGAADATQALAAADTAAAAGAAVVDRALREQSQATTQAAAAMSSASGIAGVLTDTQTAAAAAAAVLERAQREQSQATAQAAAAMSAANAASAGGAAAAGQAIQGIGPAANQASAAMVEAAATAEALATADSAAAAGAAVIERALRGQGQATSLAAAAMSSARGEASALAGAWTAAAAGAQAAEQAIRGESAALALANDNARAATAAELEHARALQEIMDAADPAARRLRQLYEVEGVLAQAVQEGTLTRQRASQILEQYSQRSAAAGQTVQQFGQRSTAGGAAASRFGLFAQQAGYQVQDFAVQVSAGQSALVAFAQQGSQLLGIFGIWGALAGAGLAIFAGLANGLGLFTSSTKENDDALELHQKTLDDWIALGERAKQTADALAYSFAGMSDATREVVRQQLQVKIDEQIAATKAAADAALKAIRDTNTEFVPGHQSLDLRTGQQVAIPAHLEFDADFKVPADLKAKLQAALQPLFEGNRKSDYLTGLYDQLVDLGKGATGPAKTMIEGWTKAVAGLSAGAEIGGEKIEVMEARMRILNGTATEADRIMVDAAAAAEHLGKAFGGAGDMLDHLILGIDTFLGKNLARDIADKAVTFAGAFGRAFEGAQTEAEIRRSIQSDLDDAAAATGGKAAERALARRRAVDKAGEDVAAKAGPGLVVESQPLIEAARAARAAKFDADAKKSDDAAAASAAKRSNAWTQESERITKATQDMRTQADTIGLTTRAAAELKAQQDLLNAAHQAGIPITDQVLAKIKAEAVAYGDASEALRKLQSQERQRQQLGGEAVSLIGSTATDEEARTRELARLQQIRALVQSGDPGTLDRLREAGYTQDDAKTAVDRQISRVANPEIYGALDGARDSFKSFIETLTGGSAKGVDAVTALGDSLEKLALDKLVVQPLDKLANQAFDKLGDIATKDGGGWLGGLLGIGAVNDNGAAAATAAATTAANASISVGAATINIAGAVAGLGGGGIPNRPDIASTGTAPAAGIAGGTGLPSLGGGVGTDTLVDGTNKIGSALQGVAQGVAQQGQTFLGGFGGVLSQLINGIGSLLGGASSGAGDFLTGIIGALGFADGAGFSNGRVITSPTIFPMDGGGIGIIREKLHDEAIMPLVNAGGSPSVKARGPGGKIVPLPIARLPDGSLGVSASNVTPFAAGGAFGGGSSWSGGGGDAPIGVTLINQTSSPLGAPKIEQRRNSQGGRDLRLTFEEMVGGALADPNSAASQGLQTPTLRGRG